MLLKTLIFLSNSDGQRGVFTAESMVRSHPEEPKVYLNLLLTETLSKLISKTNRGDITTGMSYDEMLIINKLTKPESAWIIEENY